MDATASLKALSNKVLLRNLPCNSDATTSKDQCNSGGKNEVKSCTGSCIEEMTLNKFEKAGLVLKVWSEVLKEHVYFVSSETGLNRVDYTARELQAMLNMTPEEVRVAHEVKKLFHKARVIEHRRAANG